MSSDALRSELIFLSHAGDAQRVGDCIVVRTPDNPTYWWGNTLTFDQAPVAGDLLRWTRLFDQCVRVEQPASRHTTFGWSGAVRGCVEPFVDAGFTLLESVVLAADGSMTIRAPHEDRSERMSMLSSSDWPALRDLLIETREVHHSLEGYAAFAERRIATWCALCDAGQGAWFSAWQTLAGELRLVSALGVFVEPQRGADDRRVGRFQQVVTHPAARRQGLAGTLVARASRYAFDALDADTLIIIADEHDVARRVYESTGFRRSGWQRGLELGGY